GVHVDVEVERHRVVCGDSILLENVDADATVPMDEGGIRGPAGRVLHRQAPVLVGADQADVIGRGPIDVDVDGGAVRAQRHRHGIGDVEVGVDVHHAAVAREHHRAADGDRSAGATGDVAGVVEVGARPGAGDHLDLEVEAGGVVRPGHLRLVTGLVVDLKVRVGGAARGSCRDQRGGSTLAAETAGGDRRRLRAAAEAQCLLHAARA